MDNQDYYRRISNLEILLDHARSSMETMDGWLMSLCDLFPKGTEADELEGLVKGLQLRVKELEAGDKLKITNWCIMQRQDIKHLTGELVEAQRQIKVRDAHSMILQKMIEYLEAKISRQRKAITELLGRDDEAPR